MRTEIWATQERVLHDAVAAAGIRTPTLPPSASRTSARRRSLWDRKTGRPVHNAIVWQDRRTAASCDALACRRARAALRRAHRPGDRSPISRRRKLRWLLDQCPARANARRGELAFGTVDSWLVWNLTGGTRPRHRRDERDRERCSSTSTTGDWDDELLRRFGVPRAMLPRWCRRRRVYGAVRRSMALREGCPSRESPATSRRRCSGRPASRRALAKNTYGTGCFMLLQHRRAGGRVVATSC